MTNAPFDGDSDASPSGSSSASDSDDMYITDTGLQSRSSSKSSSVILPAAEKPTTTKQNGFLKNGSDLFEDKPSVENHRKLEAAIYRLNMQMLEGVRLSLSRLMAVMEHPRADQYLIGSYVRYPDVEGSGLRLPNQIIRCTESKGPRHTTAMTGEKKQLNWDLVIVQYALSPDNIIARRRDCDIWQVAEEPFTPDEFDTWVKSLRLFGSRPGAEKLHKLPESLQFQANRLSSFTFTDADVELILQRKNEESGTHVPHSRTEAYLKRIMFETSLKELKQRIKDSEGSRIDRDVMKQISDLEKKLEDVNRRINAISFLTKPTLTPDPSEARAMGRTQFGASNLREPARGRIRNKLKSPDFNLVGVYPSLGTLVGPDCRRGYVENATELHAYRIVRNESVHKVAVKEWGMLSRVWPTMISASLSGRGTLKVARHLDHEVSYFIPVEFVINPSDIPEQLEPLRGSNSKDD